LYTSVLLNSGTTVETTAAAIVGRGRSEACHVAWFREQLIEKGIIVEPRPVAPARDGSSARST
jgi:hypothetical protein